MPRPPIDQINAVVVTHTTRHLRHVLMGVAHQHRRADRVVVGVDNDKPEVAAVVRDAAREFAMPITLVQRPFMGVGRVAQTRNNAVRALIDDGGISEAGLLVFFDGDCCPMPDVLSRYAALAALGDLLIGWRVYLDEHQTEHFDEQAVREHRPPGLIPREMFAGLRRRHRRFIRQNLTRPLGLAKPHKPKVLGGNHAVRWPAYRAVNGYDEAFQGWGSEDDDLGRRIYRAGGKAVVAVKDVLCYHLYHPEQPKDNAATKQARAALGRRFEAKAEFGLDHPLEQRPPAVVAIRP